jgi:hypothetical protein
VVVAVVATAREQQHLGVLVAVAIIVSLLLVLAHLGRGLLEVLDKTPQVVVAVDHLLLVKLPQQVGDLVVSEHYHQ